MKNRLRNLFRVVFFLIFSPLFAITASSQELTQIGHVVRSCTTSSGFNYQAYLSANPDLPSDWGKADCISHYIHYGFFEMRAVSFDIDEYKNANPDLPNNWTMAEGLNHYNLFGKNENRLLAFNAQEYLSLYPDLPKNWTYDQAYNHFNNYGSQEGRIASFDEKAYLEMYPDLPSSWGQAQALYHYLLYGKKEGRVYDPYDEDAFSPVFSEMLKAVRTWMYQIRDLDADGAMATLAASDYPLLVIEPGHNFKDQPYDTATMINTLRTASQGNGRRLIVAYVDIGQAEDYRNYWEADWVAPTATQVGSPDFLVTIDPDGWSGNYPVAYWKPAWKNIWLGDAGIIAQLAGVGFDGIYLDGVKSYADEKVIAAGEADTVDPELEMIRFIEELGQAGQAVSGEFIVIPQNAPYLIDAAPDRYASAIDALAVEDTWFHGAGDADWNDPDAGDRHERHEGQWSTENRLQQYKKYQNRGLPVFSVDYCISIENVNAVYKEAANAGLVPLVTRVSLSRMTETPPPSAVAANAYYVATTGSDSNPGTRDAPWQTIQHAADTMLAGDTVYIRSGTYNEHIHTRRSGTSGAYITFSAYPCETPVIDGTGVTESGNGFLIDQSYTKLIGIEIQNWSENGVWIQNAAHIELSDCLVHHVWYGIGVADGAHDFVFNRVQAHHFNLYGFDVSPSGGADCYNGTFNDCLAHTGQDPEQNVDGFALGHGNQHGFAFNRCETYGVYDGFDISSRNTTLNRCSAHDCGNGGYKLWQDNVTLVNCLSYDNEVSNVELDWDGQAGTVTLKNCTLFDAKTFNVWVESAEDSLHMYNCILAGGDNLGLAFEQMGVGNYRGDYNLFHNDNADRAVGVGYTDEFSLSRISDGSWTTYSGQDAHSLIANSATALFVNPAYFDLHLTSNSSAVDKGTPSYAPSEDYDGQTRPKSSGYDIGAYEY